MTGIVQSYKYWTQKWQSRLLITYTTYLQFEVGCTLGYWFWLSACLKLGLNVVIPFAELSTTLAAEWMASEAHGIPHGKRLNRSLVCLCGSIPGHTVSASCHRPIWKTHTLKSICTRKQILVNSSSFLFFSFLFFSFQTFWHCHKYIFLEENSRYFCTLVCDLFTAKLYRSRRENLDRSQYRSQSNLWTR